MIKNRCGTDINKSSNFGEKNRNTKYTWNQSSNAGKNALSCGTSNDKKYSWKTNNNNFTIESKSNQELMNEFEIMKMLDHPNVLKAVEIIYDDKKVPSILYEKYLTDFI